MIPCKLNSKEEMMNYLLQDSDNFILLEPHLTKMGSAKIIYNVKL